MADANSTTKRNFSNNLSYKIWANHSSAVAIEALLCESSWEESKELTAVKYLINAMQDSLSNLANMIDESTLNFIAKQSNS